METIELYSFVVDKYILKSSRVSIIKIDTYIRIQRELYLDFGLIQTQALLESKEFESSCF